MKDRNATLKMLFVVLACAAACDQVQPDHPLEPDVMAPDREDSEILADAALQALESEEIYETKFWLNGLKSGSVNLGSWSCTPPPPPTCKKTATGYICEPVSPDL